MSQLNRSIKFNRGILADQGIVRLTGRELVDQERSRFSRGKLTPFSERGNAVLLEDFTAG